MQCERKSDEPTYMHESAHWLVLLYGSLEYDGRVRRVIDILESMGGRIAVVDTMRPGASLEHEDTGVRRIRILPPARGTMVLGHMRFAAAVLTEALRSRPKVVIAEDYFTAVLGLVAARLSRALFIYDAHELIIPEHGRRRTFREWFWYSLERLAAPRAGLVIAANEDRAQIMAAHYGLSRVPEVMRNIPTVDGAGMSQTELAMMYPELVRATDDEVQVIYQGAMSLKRGLGTLVAAMTHLPSRYRLLMVGDGPDLEAIREVAAEILDPGRFHAFGRVQNSDLNAITSSADVGIVAYPNEGLNNIYCAPNKLFEYAQAGLPVVATAQPLLSRLVQTYGIGEVVNPDSDAAELARAIAVVTARGKHDYADAVQQFLRDHEWSDEALRIRAALRLSVCEWEGGKCPAWTH